MRKPAYICNEELFMKRYFATFIFSCLILGLANESWSQSLSDVKVFGKNRRYFIQQFWNEDFRQEIGFSEAEIAELEVLKADWKAPLLANAADGIDLNDALMAHSIQDAMTDDFIASLKRVSPAKYVLAAQATNRDYLFLESTRPGRTEHPSFLTSPTLAEELNLTKEQLREVEIEATKFSDSRDDRSKEHIEQSKEIWEKHRNEIVKQMPREVRARIVKVLGDPFWSFYLRADHVLVSTHKSAEDAGTNWTVLFPELMRSREKASRDPDSSWSDDSINLMTIAVVGSDEVRKELEIDSETSDALDQVMSHFILTKLAVQNDKNRTSDLLLGEADLPAKIRDHLSSQQTSRLLKIELQLRLGNWTSFGLLHEATINEWRLANELRNELEKEVEAFEEELQTLRSNYLSELQELNKEHIPSALEILDEKQLVKYRLLTGINVSRDDD